MFSLTFIRRGIPPPPAIFLRRRCRLAHRALAVTRPLLVHGGRLPSQTANQALCLHRLCRRSRRPRVGCVAVVGLPFALLAVQLRARALQDFDSKHEKHVVHNYAYTYNTSPAPCFEISFTALCNSNTKSNTMQRHSIAPSVVYSDCCRVVVPARAA